MEVIAFVAILAILLGLLFSVPSANRGAVRRAQAQTEVRNIATAIANFKTDYGAYPRIGKPRLESEAFVFLGDPAAGAQISNREVFDVLRAIPRGANSGDALNLRRIRYYEGPIAKNPASPQGGFADGKSFSKTVEGSLFDPWGQQYCVVLEADTNAILDLGTIYSDLKGAQNQLSSGHVGFSLGADGMLGGKDHRGALHVPGSNERPEDVVSWE